MCRWCSPSTIHWIHLDAFGGFPSKHQQCILHPIPFWIFIFLKRGKTTTTFSRIFPSLSAWTPVQLPFFQGSGMLRALQWGETNFCLRRCGKTCCLQYHNYTTIGSTFFFNSRRCFKHIALGLPCIHSRSLRGGSNWLATECCMRRWQSPVSWKRQSL